MGKIAKELYEAILKGRHFDGPNKFEIDGTEYAQMSSYAPTYSGSWSWEENTEMLVIDHEGNMYWLTLWTDRLDIDYPTEYNYQLRYFYSMLADDPEKYFEF